MVCRVNAGSLDRFRGEVFDMLFGAVGPGMALEREIRLGRRRQMDQSALIPSATALADPTAWLVGVRAVVHGVSALSALIVLGVAAIALRDRRDLSATAAGLWLVAALLLLAALLTNLVLLVTLWQPAVPTQVAVGLIAAAVSLGTAILLWPQLPSLLALLTPGEQAHESLESGGTGTKHDLEDVRRFDLALSSSKITVFTQDRELHYTWLHNPRPGLTPPAAGEADNPEPPEALTLKREALATGRTRTGGISVALPDGVHHFDLTVSPTRGADGTLDGLLGTAVDVTERRLFDVRLAAMAAHAATAYRRFDLALEDSPITVFEQDTDLRYTFMHNPPPGTTSEQFIGRTDAELFGERDLRRLSDLKRRVIGRGERATAELDLGIGGTQRFFALRLDPKTGESGEIEGVIGTAVDLTERRRHEQNMKLVMRELTHRSKNLLAVVQAMARKTASAAPDTDRFIRDFSSRLRAIAAAHDLLVAESWSGADLRDLLAVSLSQTVDLPVPEVSMAGPDLKLAPDAAQMLALAFHELTMNAVKFGALSTPGGRISVRWSDEGDSVRLCWREEDGPTVVPPGQSGFGRILLERLVGASLGGSAALDFPADGLVCVLTFPKDRLIAA